MTSSFAFVIGLVLMPLLVDHAKAGENAAATPAPIALGSQWQPIVDDFLIERLSAAATLKLHRPDARNVAMVTDAPWEGNACHYRTVFRDGDIVRMYYQCGHYAPPDVPKSVRKSAPDGLFCYAESRDGITFTRPSLGLYEFNGSRDNNILFDGNVFQSQGILIPEAGISVFKDTNPACLTDARYKAVAIARLPGERNNAGLAMLKSTDGLRWSLLTDKPPITDGRFDSQNLAFFDTLRGEYRAYHRDTWRGIRGIKTETSADFLAWSKPRFLDFGDAPSQSLYTSQIQPYARAPHLFVGFPLRYVEHQWSPTLEALPGLKERRIRSTIAPRYGTAITDALFMASRDGVRFKRWDEAFIRPRGGTRNWVYGDNSIAWGIVETPPDIAGSHPELSFYVTEGYWVGQSLNVRRYALRPDGFVSIHAPLSGGEVLTRPLTFTGNQLNLNFATSAPGNLRVELQNKDGQPLPGFAAADCLPIFGDHLDYTVRWSGGSNVGKWQKHQIRIRFILSDADLWAFGFN